MTSNPWEYNREEFQKQIDIWERAIEALSIETRLNTFFVSYPHEGGVESIVPPEACNSCDGQDCIKKDGSCGCDSDCDGGGCG